MRIYTELGCGCLISCDGGGGLIDTEPYFEGNEEAVTEHQRICKVKEYMEEHKLEDGSCVICG